MKKKIIRIVKNNMFLVGLLLAFQMALVGCVVNAEEKNDAATLQCPECKQGKLEKLEGKDNYYFCNYDNHILADRKGAGKVEDFESVKLKATTYKVVAGKTVKTDDDFAKYFLGEEDYSLIDKNSWSVVDVADFYEPYATFTMGGSGSVEKINTHKKGYKEIDKIPLTFKIAGMDMSSCLGSETNSEVYVKVTIPAPKVNVKKKKVVFGGIQGYSYTFDVKAKGASKVIITTKNSLKKDAENKINKHFKSQCKKKKLTANIKSQNIKKKKVQFQVYVIYGDEEHKSAVAKISK